MIPLEQDKRWQRFNNPDRACPCCGRQFAGMFEIEFGHPEQWRHQSLRVSGQSTLEIGGDRLTEDLCQVGDSFFIRASLELPLLGSDQPLTYSPWVGVTVDNFKLHLESRQSGDFSGFSECNGWLMNYIPGWDQNNWLPASLGFSSEAPRPKLTVFPHHHPLAAAQRNGVDFDRVLDLFAAAGHDIRPHLLAD